MDSPMNFSTAIVLQFLFIWVAFWMMIPSHEKKNSLNISNRYQVQTRSWFTLWFPFILDHYDKEVAFLADTNQLLNFLIKLNQRIMLPADVIWIDFKYNFLTPYFLWRENLYSLYQKPDDSNGVAMILVVEFQTRQN